MGELLLRKILACRERIDRLRAAIPAQAEAVAADERLEAFLSFHLFLLIQDAVDRAAHLVAERGLAVPASQRESFEALARAGVLTSKSAEAMARLASLRNRIAHSYGDFECGQNGSRVARRSDRHPGFSRRTGPGGRQGRLGLFAQLRVQSEQAPLFLH